MQLFWHLMGNRWRHHHDEISRTTYIGKNIKYHIHEAKGQMKSDFVVVEVTAAAADVWCSALVYHTSSHVILSRFTSGSHLYPKDSQGLFHQHRHFLRDTPETVFILSLTLLMFLSQFAVVSLTRVLPWAQEQTAALSSPPPLTWSAYCAPKAFWKLRTTFGLLRKPCGKQHLGPLPPPRPSIRTATAYLPFLYRWENSIHIFLKNIIHLSTLSPHPSY